MAHSFTSSVQIHNTTIGENFFKVGLFSSSAVVTYSTSRCLYPSPRGDPLVTLSSKWSHLTRRLWWPRSAIKRPWRTVTWRCSSAPQRRWASCWWEEPWTAAASPLRPASFHVSRCLYDTLFFHLMEHRSTKQNCLEQEWEHILFYNPFSDSVITTFCLCSFSILVSSFLWEGDATTPDWMHSNGVLCSLIAHIC